MSRDDEERKRHEYLLREIRLSAEDIKDYICKEVEPRIKSLEATRDYGRGVMKTVGIGIPAVGTLSWYFWLIVKEVKQLKGG